MEKTILKVGDKAKGFRFKDETDRVSWFKDKKKHVGEIGRVTRINSNLFTIDFGDDRWDYPISLMHLAVVEEEPKELPLKVGDKAKGFKFENKTDGVMWCETQTHCVGKIGKVARINSNLFTIEFEDDWWRYPISLMHLAVVEEEPKVIEVDMNKVEKIEFLMGGVWKEYVSRTAKKYRYTMKDESKLKIEQEIKELENRIKKLKRQL